MNAEEAVRLARLAVAAGLPRWVKLEIHPDPRYLLPDPIETFRAAEILVKEGFTVLPYINADPVLAKRLQDIGVATVMPLGSPIGSNRGVQTRDQIRIIIEQAIVPVVVDAGLGAPSHAAEAMEMAQHSGDDFQVDAARVSRGLVLINQGGSQRAAGFALLAEFREANLRHGYAKNVVRTVDTEIAKEKARTGDIDGAIQLARAVVDYTFDAGDALSLGEATRVLVESLLQRGTSADLKEAQAAIDRLAAEPTDPGYVLFELPLLRLRALLARAHGDAATYAQFRDRYRDRANTVGFEGHIALAETMT